MSYFVLDLGKHYSTYYKNLLYALVSKIVFCDSLLASNMSQERSVSTYAIIIPIENISYLPASTGSIPDLLVSGAIYPRAPAEHLYVLVVSFLYLESPKSPNLKLLISFASQKILSGFKSQCNTPY